MPKIIYAHQAKKDLRKLSKNQSRKILKRIEILESSPLNGKPLLGKLGGKYSLHVWPYRIIYSFQKRKNQVWILRIVHRQGAYH